MTDPPPFPSDWSLEVAGDLRRRDSGRVLIGGAPLRILRLSDAGSLTVTRWFAGAPVGPSDQQRQLAGRLIDAGMATATPPSPDDPAHSPELTVVVPVKDDAAGLRRTLAGLGDLPVIVVDDGSTSALELPSTSPDHHHLIRRPITGGPAAARNTGTVGLSTRLVAFVDAGVTVDADDLRRLGRLFDEPELAAAAPRVASETTGAGARSIIGRYEQQRSPLDLGAAAAKVGPGGRITYVPTACLVVRRADLVECGGFEEGMRYGEDVDLIWRLSSEHSIRYEPSITTHHPPRRSIGAFVRQRFCYGTAAGPLGRRHGVEVAPVRSSGWSLGVAGVLAAGHPIAAAGLAAGTAAALVPKLGTLPDARVEAALLTARGHGWTLRSMTRAAVRTWWPLSALALISGLGRRTAIVAVALGWTQRLLDRPPEPVIDLTLGAVDDISYGAGVWLGALRSRTFRPLLPHLANWPPRD